MNIVIIDDDKLVAMSLKTILESTGSVNVLAIGSCGEEAIELYTLLKPDVLLMDIRMNGMSGIEAGEKILFFLKGDGGAIPLTRSRNALLFSRAIFYAVLWVWIGQ